MAADEAVYSPPPHPLTMSESKDADPASTISASPAPPSGDMPHPQTPEIIRQVDYYFSEQNLPYDAHLLGLIKEGNGSVSLNEIASWSRMRQYRPPAAVKAAIKLSTVVEVIGTGRSQRLRRREPLTVPLAVDPKVKRTGNRTAPPPADKPWLTKGMLKPTGFEEYATNGPIRPDEYERDRRDYDPEESFTSRIETAVMRFCARRKMHQKTRTIFNKFMIFGGMEGGHGQFTGGSVEEGMANLTKKEIQEMTSYYSVSDMVTDAFVSDDEAVSATWKVNFEGVAKAFLSSVFMSEFSWYDEEEVKTATNVLRNFYNYLMYHDVCPEFTDQLQTAREACDLAEEELVKLKHVDQSLPGGFNTACSTLFKGNYAGLHAGGGDWVKEGDHLSWSIADADKVFKAGVAALGTEEHLAKLEEKVTKNTLPAVIFEDKMGVEVVSVDPPNDEAKTIYNNPRFANTCIHPMGTIHCKWWAMPHAPRRDLSKSMIELLKAKESEPFAFSVPSESLQYYFPGLKIEAMVKELDIGIKWIDSVEAVYPSFFTWLANEVIRDWKPPGPPTGWMKRQHGGEELEVGLDEGGDVGQANVGMEQEGGEGDGDDEAAD